jgi:hypothetical protein
MYNFVSQWEYWERERELLILLITQQTHALLMDVHLLKFYEEGTSLRGNSPLLQ